MAIGGWTVLLAAPAVRLGLASTYGSFSVAICLVLGAKYKTDLHLTLLLGSLFAPISLIAFVSL